MIQPSPATRLHLVPRRSVAPIESLAGDCAGNEGPPPIQDWWERGGITPLASLGSGEPAERTQ